MIKYSLPRWPSLALFNIWYITEFHYDLSLMLLLYSCGCCCMSCCTSLLFISAAYIYSVSLLRISGAAAAYSWLLLNISDLRSQLVCSLNLKLLLLLLHVFAAENPWLLSRISGCCHISMAAVVYLCLPIIKL